MKTLLMMVLSAIILMSSNDELHLVPVITEIEIVKNNKFHKLKVTGEVPSSGYANPRLFIMLYAEPPADGIQEFKFLANPPSKNAGMAITTIEAEYLWANEDIPNWVKGVRIYGIKKIATKLIR